MKRCPTCNRTFEDDLRFCLDDGAILTIGSSDPKATSPFANQPTYGNRPSSDPFSTPSSQPPAQGSYKVSPSPFSQGYSPPAQYTQRPAEFAPVAAFFLSLISLVLGLFSITLGWICLGFLTAPIAIVIGLAALVKIKFDWAKCESKVLPIITTVLSLVGILSGGFVLGIFIIYFISRMF
jgi:hypothetical protein